jgi:uncharacterized protein
MEATPSVAEKLPTEIPVFPLPGALLLPRGKLPLNIFEPRYLAMTEDALGAGRVFGMIQPDRGRAEEPTGPALFRIGCLGRLSSFAETDDGRYLITLTGMIRFRVAEELEMRRGYRRVRADYDPFAADLEAPGPIGVGRETILAALRQFFGARGLDANWEAIDRMLDDALVVTLAMACPFDVAEKQALLEAVGEAERAETLVALLRMAAHEAGSDETRNVS